MPVISGTASADTLAAPIGSWENWTINGLGGNDVLDGGNCNDILDGGPGADRMTGGYGADIYYVDNVGDVVEGAAGDEIRTTLATYQLPSDASVLTGLATTGQILSGNYSDNTINGSSGNDRLSGGAGIDRLVGGAGNDTYVLVNYDYDRSDTIVEAPGGGVDEVLVGLGSYELPANVENATATGANISLTGNALANVLRGSSVNDSLDGGAGADTMIGGAGDDWYYVDNAGDVVVEDLAASGGTSDTVVTGFSYYQLQAGVELLQGTSATQTLVGNDGNNWLMSKGGGDTLIGGLGNDLYEIQPGDVIVEYAGEGIDLVRTTMTSYTLPEHLEELQATSFSTSQTLIGNAADNRIIGTLLNNQSDTIDGRAGADLIIGYHGSDVYYVDNVGDVVQEESHHGAADEVRTTIDLTLFGNVEKLTALSATGLRLTGNGLSNTITGGDGNDRLEGLGGADTLNGGIGDDILSGGAANDVMAGGGGADRFVYLNLSDSTVSAFDTITLFETGADQIDLTAFRVRSVTWTTSSDASGAYNMVTVDTEGGQMTVRVNGMISSSDFLYTPIDPDRQLTGTADDDILQGGGGNDTLDGGAGSDTMAGGTGNDRFAIDDAGDVVAEAAGEGDDLLVSGVNYILGAGVSIETMIAADSAVAIALTGNELGQSLYGNDAANRLDGGGGADYLVAGWATTCSREAPARMR